MVQCVSIVAVPRLSVWRLVPFVFVKAVGKGTLWVTPSGSPGGERCGVGRFAALRGNSLLVPSPQDDQAPKTE